MRFLIACLLLVAAYAETCQLPCDLLNFYCDISSKCPEPCLSEDTTTIACLTDALTHINTSLVNSGSDYCRTQTTVCLDAELKAKQDDSDGSAVKFGRYYFYAFFGILGMFLLILACPRPFEWLWDKLTCRKDAPYDHLPPNNQQLQMTNI